MKILPSLKQVEYLVALAEAQHFARAANACNVTPSTLSAGIKELEAVLGVELAERTKRTVLMTPVGVEIANHGRLLLGHAQDLMDLAATQTEPLTGDLHIGVIPTVSPFLLPRVLPNLMKHHPRLRPFLREEPTENLFARLRRGELDVAVVALPYDIGGFDCEIMFEDPFQLACLTDHKLVSQDLIELEDLDINTLLLLGEGHCMRGHALEACQLNERDRRSEFEATSMHTIVEMVAAGIGITLLPQIAIDDGIAKDTDINLIPITGAPSRQIGLIWRQSSSRADEFKILADELTPSSLK